MMTKVIPEMIAGLVDNVWAVLRRQRQADPEDEGRLAEGWQRTNMFFSSTIAQKILSPSSRTL